MPPVLPPENPTIVSEEASQRELATTSISVSAAKSLSLLFCAALLLPTLVHHAGEAMQGKLFEQFRSFSWPPTRDSFHALGQSVDDRSTPKQWFQPRLQEFLTTVGGFGNEKVVIGRNGWLYYAPGVRSIFGQPFLDPSYLRAKAKSMIDKDGRASAQPDPLPAIRQLAEDCRRLQIRLFLLPLPDKGTILPEHLTDRPMTQRPQNKSFEAFQSAMTASGAVVLDAAAYAEAGDSPWFLRQDTHWTPKYMDRVAHGVATALLAAHVGRPAESPRFRLVSRNVSSVGDLVTMLKLTADQRLFPPETVQIEQVEPAGPLPPGDPEVLLLGDSFTNIYSSRSLDWGDHAGLGEHLAYHLNAPVDIIARNGAGASVRSELLRAAKSGRLATTRAIVYEFAARDLYLEDWPVVALGDVKRSPAPVTFAAPPPKTAPNPPPPPALPAADSKEVIVTGKLVQISRPINPAAAPYEDALLYGKISVDKVEEGTYSKKEAIVVFLAMKARRLLPGAGHSVGESLRLKLIVMKSAPEEIRSMQRSDDTEDFDLAPYFVQAELP